MPGFEQFGEAERKEVMDVLDSGVLMRYGFDGMRNGHWKARELEVALQTRMQVQHAQVVSSGTAALTVALASAGVGAGDEVILPTFTFVASFEAVLALGAVPILVDIDDTLTLDPEAVRKAITPRTKAVMVVHMCGSMADLRALKALCGEFRILLIEDACQAVGGSYEGKPLGSYGDLGCLSFDFVKTITAGEGGAVLTDNSAFYTHADHYSDHGHTHIGTDRGAEDHPFLGYNYRLSELHAAVGLAQLRKLDEFLEVQKKRYNILKEALQSVPGISFRKVPEGGVENYSFLNFFLADESSARKAHADLIKAGVDGCFYWFDNNWHYHRKWGHLKELRALGPVSPEMTQQIAARNKADFSASDHWMGRTVSSLIKLGWSEEETKARAEAMVKALS